LKQHFAQLPMTSSQIIEHLETVFPVPWDLLQKFYLKRDGARQINGDERNS